MTTDMDSEAWSDSSDRSRGRYVHGFIFLRDLAGLMASDLAPQNSSPARFALDLLRAWEGRHPLAASSAAVHPMAYHDETTAQRMLHVLAIVDKISALGDDERTWIRAFLDGTAKLLASQDFHAGLNNHGMFQDVALFSWACLADWRNRRVRLEYLFTANDRLLDYFRQSFTREGVHIENAPNYHVLIARYLKQHTELARAAGLDQLNELEEVLAQAAVYATHAVRPDGSFPLVSDTQATHLATVAREVFADEEFLYAATAGVQGMRPSKRVLVLPDSGYAIYRSAWGDPDATYVYFSAAYNSGYHKHSDENSFWLTSEGVDLLAEAGPNGYTYDDPFTRYAYSQFAHNTLVVDGRSTPRADGHVNHVELLPLYVGPDRFKVLGRNARLSGAVHDRTFEVVEHSGRHPMILVTDEVRASSRHVYDIYWHVGDGLDVHLRGDGFDLTKDGFTRMSLTLTTREDVAITVHRGEGPPEPLGWRFSRFGRKTPCIVVRMRLRGADVIIDSAITLPDEPALYDKTDAVTSCYHNDALATETSWEATSTREPSLTVHVAADGGGRALTATMQVSGFAQYAFKLYRGSSLVAEVGYSARSHVRWAGLEPGRYRVRGYARERYGSPVNAETSESVFIR
ncbi:heparinase II/III family protein [Intrasporangium calvum]|uniref:heparinase II/III family protein n=1 Tax=Intrasporangium calvum TaxID=53358 RepID=UPI00059CDD32|nr:heparinase II/III-family protein [Intrasporangium calvum]